MNERQESLLQHTRQDFARVESELQALQHTMARKEAEDLAQGQEYIKISALLKEAGDHVLSVQREADTATVKQFNCLFFPYLA